MSGSPKYSSAELERQRQQQLEEARRRKAIEEAKLRAEAAERERLQRLQQLIGVILLQQKSVAIKIEQQEQFMYSQAALGLKQQCQSQIAIIHQARDELHLQKVAAELNQIMRNSDEAVTQKRRDDEEKKRKAEIERLQFELDELERAVKQIPAGDASKFDEAGRKAVHIALSAAQSSLSTGNPQSAQPPLSHASHLVKQHIQVVTQRRIDWEKKKADAEELTGKIKEILIGLQADPVVMRWHPHSIAQLATQLQQSQNCIISEDFSQPSQIFLNVQAEEKKIIEEANIAQLKADKRDYITQSIVATLQDMGFSVLGIEDEHKGHPATAKVFTAKAAGRAINVSVPVEGQVWYDVDGYAKNTVASFADNGSAAICDEAESVLEEMHSNLKQEFGVQMGEIAWQGKDPKRNIRTASELPSDVNRVKGAK